MSKPKVLLLDEPASGMSRNERKLIPAWIEQAKSRSSAAIIWIEHDMDLLLSSADAVVVLQHGEVVATGRPKDNPEDRQRVVNAYFRSEEHTSELQSLMRISYAVFCLKKKQPH